MFVTRDSWWGWWECERASVDDKWTPDGRFDAAQRLCKFTNPPQDDFLYFFAQQPHWKLSRGKFRLSSVCESFYVGATKWSYIKEKFALGGNWRVRLFSFLFTSILLLFLFPSSSAARKSNPMKGVLDESSGRNLPRKKKPSTSLKFGISYYAWKNSTPSTCHDDAAAAVPYSSRVALHIHSDSYRWKEIFRLSSERQELFWVFFLPPYNFFHFVNASSEEKKFSKGSNFFSLLLSASYVHERKCGKRIVSFFCPIDRKWFWVNVIEKLSKVNVVGLALLPLRS